MRLKWKILFAATFWLCCLEASSQQNRIDSLTHLIKTIKNDSAKCELLYQLGVTYSRVDYKVSLVLYDSILKIVARNKNFEKIEADAFVEIGNVGFEHGDYALSIEYYTKAEERFNSFTGNQKTSGLGTIYNNVGAILSLANDWENAQKYYLRALKEYEKLNDISRMVTTYFNIAFVYSDMDEWGKSYEHMLKSFNLTKQSRNKPQNLQTTYRLATICFKLGRIAEGQKYLNIADSLLLTLGEPLDLIYYNHAYGTYYQQVGHYTSAIEHHMRAYKTAVKWVDPYYEADETLEIGIDYLKLKKFDSAEFYFKKSYDISIKYKYKPKVLLSLISLSDLAETKGNYEEAYNYKKKQASFADSLVKEQNQYRVLLLDGEFAAQKRASEIKQLQQDKQLQAMSLERKSTLNYLLVGSIVILLVLGFLVYRNLHHRHTLAKQKEQLQQQRIRELEKDRQLIAVDSMLRGQEEERSRMAKDLHDGLGGMLSGVKLSLGAMKGNIILSEDNTKLFGRVLDQLDHSINEMRRIAHNMMPEALVKLGLRQAIQDYCDGLNESSKMNFKTQFYGLENRLDASAEIVVYRIVQELLNNVVKHSNASEALVQVMRHENNLTITIEDNGHGFDVNVIDEKKSAGLANVRSRVDYLKGQMDIQSSQPNGTSVHIDFVIPDKQ